MIRCKDKEIIRISQLVVILLLVLFVSCKNWRISKEVRRIYGTQIEVPYCLSAKIHGLDTLIITRGDEYATLIIWYDSTQCSSCSLNYIEKWNRLFEYSVDSVRGLKPMIIFSPKEKDLYRFESYLRMTNFNYPIYIDYDYSFLTRNPQLLASSRQNIFLLDKNHEIVLVGDPFYNQQMWNLYKQIIDSLVINRGFINNK